MGYNCGITQGFKNNIISVHFLNNTCFKEIYMLINLNNNNNVCMACICMKLREIKNDDNYCN